MFGRIFIAFSYKAPGELSSTVVQMDRLSTSWAGSRVPHQPYDADVLPVLRRFFRCLKLYVVVAERQEYVGSHDDAQINQPPKGAQ